MLEKDSFLQFADRPAQYKLSSDGEIIDVDIHQRIIKEATDFNKNQLDRYASELKLPEGFFIPSADKKWGFGPVLAETDSGDSNWVRLRCDIPKNEKKDEIEWDSLYSVSATLEVLLDNMRFSRTDTGSLQRQTLNPVLVQRGRNSDFYGSPISAVISPALARWVGANADEDNEKSISEVMQASFKRMRGGKFDFYTMRDFKTSLRPPQWINLRCPGDACGLDPEDYAAKNEGYELTPHNTDSALQQLTLLTGLAKLSDLASDAQ